MFDSTAEEAALRVLVYYDLLAEAGGTTKVEDVLALALRGLVSDLSERTFYEWGTATETDEGDLREILPHYNEARARVVQECYYDEPVVVVRRRVEIKWEKVPTTAENKK